ncbi:MAG: hypothetical protein NVS3B20_20360 [Polyangiales bacterium]
MVLMSTRRSSRKLVYKRGRIYWTSFDGQRVSTGKKSEVAAIAWRAIEERRRADPAYAAAQSTTLLDAVKLFNAELVSGGRAHATRVYYVGKLGHLLRVLGDDRRLATIDNRAVEDEFVKVRLEEEASRRELSKELSALRGVLSLARHRGLYAWDPVLVMPRKFAAPYVPRERYLTPDQLASVLGHMSPHRAAWVAFSAATGARAGEVNRARRADVDIAARTVVIHATKTGRRDRLVPILDHALPLLERCLRDGDGKGGALFTEWMSSNTSRDIGKACEAVGVPRMSPNDIRRSLATWLVQAGAPTYLVAFMLGHKSSSMVEKVYGRMTAGAVGALLKKTPVQVKHNGEAAIDSEGFRRVDSNHDSENQKTICPPSPLLAIGNFPSEVPCPRMGWSADSGGHWYKLSTIEGALFGDVLDTALGIGGAS